MNETLLIDYVVKQMRRLLRFGYADPLRFFDLQTVALEQGHEGVVVALQHGQTQEWSVYQGSEVMEFHREHVALVILIK